jgi:hypothetical protein
MYATILTGCFESAIEYVILKQKLHVDITIAQGKSVASERQETLDHSPQTGIMSQGSSDMILHLFGKMRKLHDIVKEKITLPRGTHLAYCLDCYKSLDTN